MTIKAAYNTDGEKVFRFADYIGPDHIKTSNTNYENIGASFADEFDGNEITVFEGDDLGYFLTVMHDGEPVYVIQSFLTMSDLNYFINLQREQCALFNLALSNDNKFFTYYLLHQMYGDPLRPYRHFLIKYVRTAGQFVALYECYESLYEKISRTANQWEIDELLESLTEHELSLFKLSLFCRFNDYCMSIYPFIFSLSEPINTGAFLDFGISDDTIDDIFKTLKMNKYYYVSAIKSGKRNPSVYYFENGEVKSYLTQEDEVDIWRAGKKYREYLAKNYDEILDANEQDDRG